MHESKKSDLAVVAVKPTNKAGGITAAEPVEPRAGTEGSVGQQSTHRTQIRARVSQALERVRQAAKARKKERFTALLHHVDLDLLRLSFYALKRNAVPGVDGVTWQDYEANLESNLQDLHSRVHRGAYRAQPSRRKYIPKPDGRQRPLGIAAVEDKILQRAVVAVLNAIYEEDFLGFSYGFRPKRSQHDALDALIVGIQRKKVNWILDLDVRDFFGTVSREWLIRFLEHRIGDERILRLIRKWLKAGVLEEGIVTEGEAGTPQGATVTPWTQKVTSSLSERCDWIVQYWLLTYVANGNTIMTYGPLHSHRKGSALERGRRPDRPRSEPQRGRRGFGRGVRAIAAPSVPLFAAGAGDQASGTCRRAEHPHYDQGACRRCDETARLRPCQRHDDRSDGGALSRQGAPAWLIAVGDAMFCISNTPLTACWRRNSSGSMPSWFRIIRAASARLRS